MLVKLTCPGCGRNIEVSGDSEASVQSFPCPACSEPVRMPLNLLDVGTVLGGFEIEKHLGCGAMGSVYVAKQISVGRQVALKVMAENHGLSARASDDFLKETQLLAQLDHPNIVGAIDGGVENGYHYVAMRYLKGNDLEQRVLQEGPLSEKRALRIFLLLAKALGHAWSSHAVLHRDLKPANIMLIENDEPVLLDLGLSKVYGTQSQYSMNGQLVGTPFYMSPEQAAGKGDQDYRADIYSLGCSLFFALTGQVPYEADDIVTVLLKHATDPIPSPNLHGAKVSRGCEQLLQRMMAKEPGDRHASWPELIEDIKASIRQRKKRPAPRPSRSIAATRKPVEHDQSRNRVIVAAALGLALFLLTAGIVAMCYILDRVDPETAEIEPTQEPSGQMLHKAARGNTRPTPVKSPPSKPPRKKPEISTTNGKKYADLVDALNPKITWNAMDAF